MKKYSNRTKNKILDKKVQNGGRNTGHAMTFDNLK
jgi:hypothetical protein